MSAVGDDAFSDAVVLLCDAGAPLCQGGLPASPERVAEVRATLASARAELEPVGLWPGAPVVVLDAPLGRSAAFSVRDAASVGLDAYAGRPATLFAVNVEPDLDVVVHELTHVWMRAAGWNPPRWELGEGRAIHQSALIHEGLADFVAAALTHDSSVAEGLGSRSATRDVARTARCPDDLTGFPHLDAAVVSGALWELSGADGAPADLERVLGAIVASGPSHTDRVDTWVGEMTSRLSENSPSLAMRWLRIVDEHGLRHCGDAIPIDGEEADLGQRSRAEPARPWAAGPGRAAAGGGGEAAGSVSPGPSSERSEARSDRGVLGVERLAAGTGRFGVEAVTGPLRFRRDLDGEPALRITGSSGRPGLALRWRLDDGEHHAVAQGVSALEGAPVWTVDIDVPARARTLELALSSSRAEDTTFELLSVAPIAARSATPPAAPPSGCAAGLAVEWLPTLIIGVILARRRRSRLRSRAPSAPACPRTGRGALSARVGGRGGATSP